MTACYLVTLGWRISSCIFFVNELKTGTVAIFLAKGKLLTEPLTEKVMEILHGMKKQATDKKY